MAHQRNTLSGKRATVWSMCLLMSTLVTSSHAFGYFCSLFHGECRLDCHPTTRYTVTHVNFLCKAPLLCCKNTVSRPMEKSLQIPDSTYKIWYRPSRFNPRPLPLLPVQPSTTAPTTKRYNWNIAAAVKPVLTCGVTGNSRVRRVVNGIPAARCQYPWMVLIDRGAFPSDTCGGSLISNQHIITAAHCFDHLQGRWPTLIIGEYDRNEFKSGSELVITQYSVTRYPDYSSWSYRNDIALLTLATPIDLSRYQCLRPICLPEAFTPLPVGTWCEVAGWGLVQRQNVFPLKAAHTLRHTSIQAVHPSVCQNEWKLSFFKTTHICAGDLSGITDSCGGDSGGPLMCRDPNKDANTYFLLGVVSIGYTQCAQPGVPALYTDVRKYLGWIQTLMTP